MDGLCLLTAELSQFPRSPCWGTACVQTTGDSVGCAERGQDPSAVGRGLAPDSHWHEPTPSRYESRPATLVRTRRRREPLIGRQRSLNAARGPARIPASATAVTARADSGGLIL